MRCFGTKITREFMKFGNQNSMRVYEISVTKLSNEFMRCLVTKITREFMIFWCLSVTKAIFCCSSHIGPVKDQPNLQRRTLSTGDFADCTHKVGT